MKDEHRYLWDRSGEMDPDIKHLEELLQPLGYRVAAASTAWVGYLYSGLAVAATLLLFSLHQVWSPATGGEAAWQVRALAGAPRVNAQILEATGRLRPGQWLITDDSSAALLDVADIGYVRIEPNSRVRLMSTAAANHRLSLAEGMVHASVWAPPRLFFIETPSAVAVDLGCEYTLRVDRKGNGVLCVESGWVSLEHNGRAAVVPSGAQCELRQDIGPGTPYLAGASPEYLRRLRRFDFEPGGKSEIVHLLEMATPCEAFSLVHMVRRVDGETRGLIFDRVAAVQPPWSGITREGIVALNGIMVSQWRDQFECFESEMCRASCLPEPF